MISVNLYITKQHVYGTCFIAPYMALFWHVLTAGHCVCFFRISWELWVGVNRSVVVKSSNQVNKSWVNNEAWYSFFTFSKPAGKSCTIPCLTNTLSLNRFICQVYDTFILNSNEKRKAIGCQTVSDTRRVFDIMHSVPITSRTDSSLNHRKKLTNKR